MKKLLLFPCLLLALTSFAQTNLTIQSLSEKCASVVSSGPNSALGDRDFRASRNLDFHGTMRSLIQFDLSSIPKGSFINWARLNLFGDVCCDSGPNSFILRRITSAWDPAKVTWNIQPSTSKRGQVHLPSSMGFSETYKNINVTNMVQAMVDSPSTSFGFEIKLDTENGSPRAILFGSPGDGLLHYCPKIVIAYTPPGMNPAITSVSVANGLSTEMTIYPNPCNKSFNCNIKSAAQDKETLRVIDILGRTVYSQPVNTSNLQVQVNLPSSSAGTYFVILQDNKNTTLTSQQLQVN